MILRFIKQIILVAILILAIACGKTIENTPENVAEAYVEAMYKTDIKTLKELKKPGDVIETIDETALEKVLKSMTSEIESAGSLESVSSEKAEIDSTGNFAVVKVNILAVNGMESEINCEMIKFEGKWYFASISHGKGMDNFKSVQPHN